MNVARGRSTFGRRGTRRSVAVPNGEGVASGSATRIAISGVDRWKCFVHRAEP